MFFHRSRNLFSGIAPYRKTYPRKARKAAFEEFKMTNQADENEDSVKQSESEVKKEKTGRGWHGNPDKHAEAGSVGGQKVAEDRDHMAEIGKKGGRTVSQNRAHMAEIGRRGGLSRAAKANRNSQVDSPDKDDKSISTDDEAGISQ